LLSKFHSATRNALVLNKKKNLNNSMKGEHNNVDNNNGKGCCAMQKQRTHLEAR
jgi:hypothetical protein